MTTKICNTCNIEKLIEEYPICNKEKNYRRKKCNTCHKYERSQYYHKNKELKNPIVKFNNEIVNNNKICNTCNLEKSLDEFSKCKKKKNRKTYIRNNCKNCSNEQKKLDYQKNKKDTNKVYKTNNNTKICSKCNVEKSLDQYSNRVGKKFLYKLNKCKQCSSDYNKEYIKNKTVIPIYDKICKKCSINKDIIHFQIKNNAKDGYKSHCKDCNKKIKKNYNFNNKEKIAFYNHKMYQINKIKIKIYSKNYSKKYSCIKMKNDIYFKIKHRLRGTLNQILKRKNTKKYDSALKLVGCTIKELKYHIENQWEDGMNWNNWSVNGWHVDHIIPIDAFDLNYEYQRKECFNFKNLQPLWSNDNWKKSNNYFIFYHFGPELFTYNIQSKKKFEKI